MIKRYGRMLVAESEEVEAGRRRNHKRWVVVGASDNLDGPSSGGPSAAEGSGPGRDGGAMDLPPPWRHSSACLVVGGVSGRGALRFVALTALLYPARPGIIDA